MLVCLDPGHGGSDLGAISNGIYEKDITLKLAQKVKDNLTRKYVVDVLLTREKDEDVSLKDRADMANKAKANFFLSLHVNAGKGEGYEDYIYNSLSVTSKTAALREIVHSVLANFYAGYRCMDRGMKKANYYVLRETDMSAVLCENLFVDSAYDEKLLKDEAFIENLSRAYVEAIAMALNLSKKSSTLYAVQVGAYSSIIYASRVANDLKAKGYDAVIKEIPNL
ncbi:N-acetylmuramoyl-L-alanine amidase [Caldanaerobius polysaccharolyticus]|uniref:N-acetylmuramoyl-L-alanine amidase n=1 Tax=Caldanaerobius polysaccharolyticus TaxID=44256 RepID=UPI001C54CE57|nr:N-acetylmuramoyl-L-alanine amidase [Caldanaerobius polysaccharolyticus]